MKSAKWSKLKTYFVYPHNFDGAAKNYKKVNLMLLLREIKRSQCYINFKTMEKHGFQSLNVLLLKFLTSATEAFTK